MMDPNMTTKTFKDGQRESRSLPSWRGLGTMLALLVALLLATTVAFAQPITDPFAVPFDASAELDRAREADVDRLVAQGEYYADIWEASAVASTMRYEAMAADYEARLERSAAAGVDRYNALAASFGAYDESAYSDYELVLGGDESIFADYEFVLLLGSPAIRVGANPSMNAGMSVAQWYALPGIASGSDDSFCAENPELIIASQYADEAVAVAVDDFYALNPELISVSNWTPAVADGSDGSFYAQNPELLTAQNWAAIGGTDLICGAC